jgi:hypothetical protein
MYAAQRCWGQPLHPAELLVLLLLMVHLLAQPAAVPAAVPAAEVALAALCVAVLHLKIPCCVWVPAAPACTAAHCHGLAAPN